MRYDSNAGALASLVYRSTSACIAVACACLFLGCSSDESPDGQASTVSAFTDAPSGESEAVLTITGVDGTPLPGATISVEIDERRRITRFADSRGRVSLTRVPRGTGPITVRHPGMMTRTIPTLDAAGVALDFDTQFRRNLASNAWLELLPDGVRKREFILNCGTCHEISHDRIMADGQARSSDHWRAAIAMMRAMDAYEVIPPDFDDAGYATWLAEHLDEPAIDTLRPPARARPDDLARIEITEYALPEAASLPHDLVIGPDGRIWITAFFFDELWALDPHSGAIERFPVDTKSDLNAQPRALEFDASGTLWLVNGASEAVLRFDPKTGDYEEIPIGMYAHSIDIGPRGEAWVNDYFSERERIARIDPADSSVAFIAVPASGRPAEEGLPLPYGLQVDSLGRVYSTQLAANTLIRYDSADGQSQLLEMPSENSGPRRPGLDSRNRLWIPEFTTGHITLFEPDSATFTRVRLGDSSIGLYDIEVNQANDDVWATGSLASTLIRYRPKTRDILTVPLPTEPAYTRHIAVDEPSGDVWTAYSSLPPADPRVARIRFLE